MLDAAATSIIKIALIIFAVLGGLYLSAWQGLKFYRSRPNDTESQPTTQVPEMVQPARAKRMFFQRSSNIKPYREDEPPKEISTFSDSDDDLPVTPVRRGNKRVQIGPTLPAKTYNPSLPTQQFRYSALEDRPAQVMATTPTGQRFVIHKTRSPPEAPLPALPKSTPRATPSPISPPTSPHRVSSRSLVSPTHVRTGSADAGPSRFREGTFHSNHLLLSQLKSAINSIVAI